ncbi:MAG: alanine--tRNA ligase [Nanoarchaeota archaeon]
MQSNELKTKYLEFFKSKKHAIIPSSSLMPEHDPTVLFTTAGMHPLVPYLLGQRHPSGKRLVNYQKCLRTDDIEEVGDSTHLTFFEMLGNWSLGDYFKEDAINFSYEFLTKNLKLDSKRIHVSCFKGDKDAPKDEESARVWLKLGMPKERIYFFGKKENWWGPAGQTGPCGPDTEMYYDTLKEKCSKDCMPGCSCGKYVEIWNDVFMQYNKTEKGYEKLKQQNVDTGMGLERTTMVLQNKSSVFDTDLFQDIIKKISSLSNKDDLRAKRIIADHLRASVFILAEKIPPSNVEHGYILRRLIRRAIRYGHILGINNKFTKEIAEVIIKRYKNDYKELGQNKNFILKEFEAEEDKFEKTLVQGLRILEKEIPNLKNKAISKELAFNLFTTYGFPLEMINEVAKENNLKVDEHGFNDLFAKHQEISRQGAEQKFRGGLADHSKEVVRMHTATHLLHKALRDVLGDHVRQMGSNITKERLRFDFVNPKAMTKEEIKKVEDIVNKKIKEGLKVERLEMRYQDAIKKGALAFFKEKYPGTVSVYKIGEYSTELCGGPHIKNTKEIKSFRIIKEEAVSAGVRRIKAVVG